MEALFKKMLVCFLSSPGIGSHRKSIPQPFGLYFPELPGIIVFQEFAPVAQVGNDL